MQSNRNAMKQNYSLSQLMLLWFECALKIQNMCVVEVNIVEVKIVEDKIVEVKIVEVQL